MKDLALINPRNVTLREASNYSLREAARAIVYDRNGMVALLYVTRDSYYKLPGGGLEDGEDRILALQRECSEEIGCMVEVLDELGCTTEYWKEDTERQISYCYTAKVIGPKGTPMLTESEMERGFVTIWLPLEEAIERMKSCNPTHWEGDYITMRELVFLKEAQQYLNP